MSSTFHSTNTRKIRSLHCSPLTCKQLSKCLSVYLSHSTRNHIVYPTNAPCVAWYLHSVSRGQSRAQHLQNVFDFAGHETIPSQERVDHSHDPVGGVGHPYRSIDPRVPRRLSRHLHTACPGSCEIRGRLVPANASVVNSSANCDVVGLCHWKSQCKAQ